MDLQAEELALGVWPRRLLYVPTLTSYNWTAGNTYNGFREPKYNALTYTWGRYRLDKGPDPINIQGCNWDIPRIDTHHFTAEEFKTAVQTAGTHQNTEEPEPCEFLWLDVACIDQRDSEPRSAAEIGRQGVIFRNASHVLVWLTSFKEAELKDLLALVALGVPGENAQDPPSSQQLQAMTTILSDPWFSSLWTLQEAFLRQGNIRIMTHDAHLIPFEPGEMLRSWAQRVKGKTYAEIGFLCAVGARWYDECQELLSSDNAHDRQEYEGFLKTIIKRGTYHLYINNELAMYEAAQSRTSSRPEDRIYGIQQIFGFRVGKSAVDAPPGKSYAVGELENLLGEQLLLHYPIASQFHTFNKHVEEDRRWRLGVESKMIVSLWGIIFQQETLVDPSLICKFWIDHSSAGRKAVWWKGITTSLFEIKQMWDTLIRLHKRPNDPAVCIADAREHGQLTVLLDRVNESSEIIGAQDDSMATVVERLLKKYPPERLKVLLLGPTPLGDYNTLAGLVLVHSYEERWTRLGLCHWIIPYRYGVVGKDDGYLRGQGEKWQNMQGIFGYLG
ncbi:hypothetical protein EJ04DRAFT_573251 [Polyplosphaeria fusca]|uniref:Heterokaryon incompatibility domain-containing protein n=1 Tax=Polyplosphaeria fusca TaxID=682080 RepID=A0A9P4R9Q1_9PLEO|nr:hypothetical protein EJ04DRAFT_573251 [Polyplosphaeria fusca]